MVMVAQRRMLQRAAGGRAEGAPLGDRGAWRRGRDRAAGAWAQGRRGLSRCGSKAAIEAGAKVLDRGGSALDAVEAAIQ